MASRDQRHLPGCVEPDAQSDAIQERASRRTCSSSKTAAAAPSRWASSISRGADRFHGVVSEISQQPEHGHEDGVHGPGRRSESASDEQLLGGHWRADPPKEKTVLLPAVGIRSIVGFDGNQTISSRISSRAVGVVELSEHVRHQGSEHLRAERRECERRLQTAADIFPGTCGTVATSNLPVLAADDRLGDLQLEHVSAMATSTSCVPTSTSPTIAFTAALPDTAELRWSRTLFRSSRQRTTTRIRAPGELHARVRSAHLDEAIFASTACRDSSARPAISGTEHIGDRPLRRVRGRLRPGQSSRTTTSATRRPMSGARMC